MITKHAFVSPQAQRQSLFRRQRQLLLSIGSVIVVLTIGSIILQCVYVAQAKALPFSKVDTIAVGGSERKQVADILTSTYAPASLNLTVQKTVIKTTLSKAGLTPDYPAVTRQLFDNVAAHRFVPFYFVKVALSPVTVKTAVDQARFDEFAKDIVPQCQREAKDAAVSVTEKGDLKLTPASEGATCTAASLRQQFATIPMTQTGVSHTVVLSVVKPAVSTDSAKRLLSQAKLFTSRQVTVQLLDKQYRPTSGQIASWLAFEKDDETKKPTVDFDEAALTAYLKSLQNDVYVAPTATLIQLKDGVEVSRQTGAYGRGIDMTKSISALRQQLSLGDGKVILEAIQLQPPITYSRSYSKTQAGLQALLNDLAATKGDYAISLRQLGGNGWSASINGGKAYTTASTYKLFVAYALLKQIESGQRQWGDAATAGRTISQCFDSMIINSDNACAEWFGETIGWKAITGMIHAVGLSGKTSLYSRNGFVATADDEALFLTKLQTGQLLNPDSTGRLLDVMRRQVYRAGIPTGAGAPVADKVGFLNGLLHDAAIVYAPSGTYVLVIMTNGSSWGQIADATRQIAALLQ